ncbi:choice-of-anchor D domain-containing protein [Myxococcota bacterium]|nr:choice-of-anchor D domain-containing protein [Myxococcota bacterium]
MGWALAATLAGFTAGAGCSDTTLIGLRGEITVDPAEIVFEGVTLGTVETRDVKIVNSGNASLEVSDLALKLGAASLSFAGSPTLLEPDEQIIVHVTYAPVLTDEVVDALVITNDATEEPVEVPITANGVGALVPDIYADPPAVDLGVVELSTTATATIEVGNAGFGDLVVSGVRLEADPEFVLVDDGALPGATLPPGAEPATVTITYTPNAIESNYGVLYIESNDPDTAVLQVILNAEGGYPGGDGPVAVCSVTPTEARPFETLQWNGSGSYDTSGRPIVSYVWTEVSFPVGSSAGLTGSGANRSTVTDLAGEYTAQLVVTNDLGQTSYPCQAVASVVPTENLWIEMYWTYSGDDMDLHLIKPSGTLETSGDCYYANCVGVGLDWGSTGYPGDNPHLDLDDIPGTGPENINIEAPHDGDFTVVVNDYPGSVHNGTNPTYVNIYVDGALVGSFSDDMNHAEDYYWYVATISWPSGVVTPM